MQTLWMFSPPFPLPPPWIHSVPTFRLLLERSGSFSLSTQDVLSLDGVSASTPKHGVFHYLPSIPGPTVFTKACRLDPDKLASAQAEFLKMEKAGIVRRSSLPWSSPLHMVSKLDGTWRPCGDFRYLNTANVPDRYPFPTVSDFSTRISRSKLFSKLELQNLFFPDSYEAHHYSKDFHYHSLWPF